MINFSIEDLFERIDKIKELIENQEDDFDEKLLDLENDVRSEIELMVYDISKDDYDEIHPYEKEVKKFRTLLKEIKKMKLENEILDFYNPNTELNNMFPNRHDDDFDEDSMSYDSVFGDD